VTGWTGVRIPVTGFSLFQNVPTGSGARPATYTKTAAFISRG